ncbi:heme uptake protein IsdC [Bacillus sp. FJAT-50079]|uniref:heme uptake protein IsdC n=1 Tax=Bacillus sp. FJAT-50079 TaxID=2833577 RepID=UPI001BC9EF6D|nr:heme uptake protein IsdC [Bacillus sp. FJAT-50079]
MQQKNIRAMRIAIICLYMFTLFFMPQGKVLAQSDLDSLEEGAYSIDYVILHAQTESVSIANDYFEKPATLYVEDGKRYIQFPLNHSEWTKELQSPFGDTFVDVVVISEDKEANTRVVEFELDRDLSEPLEFKMHVLIESMEPVYDHRYTVRFDFDPTSIERLENAELRSEQVRVESVAAEKTEDQTENQTENLATQDENKQSEKSSGISITMVVVLLLALGVFIFAQVKRSSK